MKKRMTRTRLFDLLRLTGGILIFPWAPGSVQWRSTASKSDADEARNRPDDPGECNASDHIHGVMVASDHACDRDADGNDEQHRPGDGHDTGDGDRNGERNGDVAARERVHADSG